MLPVALVGSRDLGKLSVTNRIGPLEFGLLESFACSNWHSSLTLTVLGVQNIGFFRLFCVITVLDKFKRQGEERKKWK